MATKRLKELLEARKSSARDNSGMRNPKTSSEYVWSHFYKMPWEKLLSWTHVISHTFLDRLLILCHLPVAVNGNGTNGQVLISTFFFFWYMIDCYSSGVFLSVLTWVASLEQWEIITTLAWSWARSDDQCARSSFWIWKAKSSVSI